MDRHQPTPQPTPHPLERELLRLRQENELLKSSLQRLEGLAYRDPLTGLRNRRYFDERLEEELSRLSRTGAEALPVIAIDLDGFKQINDTAATPRATRR